MPASRCSVTLVPQPHAVPIRRVHLFGVRATHVEVRTLSADGRVLATSPRTELATMLSSKTRTFELSLPSATSAVDGAGGFWWCYGDTPLVAKGATFASTTLIAAPTTSTVEPPELAVSDAKLAASMPYIASYVASLESATAAAAESPASGVVVTLYSMWDPPLPVGLDAIELVVGMPPVSHVASTAGMHGDGTCAAAAAASSSTGRTGEAAAPPPTPTTRGSIAPDAAPTPLMSAVACTSTMPPPPARAVPPPPPPAACAAPLAGCTVALSGYQNPLRGELRDLSVKLGGKFSPDWSASCTHLICVSSGTPKYTEVVASGHGFIVSKNWLEDCGSARRRIPEKDYYVGEGGPSAVIGAKRSRDDVSS